MRKPARHGKPPEQGVCRLTLFYAALHCARRLKKPVTLEGIHNAMLAIRKGHLDDVEVKIE